MQQTAKILEFKNPITPLEKLIDLFLTDYESPGTKKVYWSELNLFFNFLGHGFYDSITPQEIRVYRDTFKDMLPATKLRKLVILRSFFNFLVGIELIKKNPADSIRLPKVDDNKQVRYLNYEQAKELLNFIRNSKGNPEVKLRDIACINLALRSGLRISEIHFLNISSIVDKGDYYRINVTGKGNKSRNVDSSKGIGIIEPVLEYLKFRNAPKEGDYPVFVSIKKGFGKNRTDNRMPVSTIFQRLKIWSRKLGLNIHFHGLRSSFSLAVHNNCDIESLRLTLGHSDLSTTGRYLRKIGNPRNYCTDSSKRYF